MIQFWLTYIDSLQVSSKQLRDDLMTLLIAGHETSAAVLTWTFYLLAKVTGLKNDAILEVPALSMQFPFYSLLENSFQFNIFYAYHIKFASKFI